MSLIEALEKFEGYKQVDALFAIERELRVLLDSRLAIHDMTYAQFSVLRFIVEPLDETGGRTDAPVSASDVAAFFGFAARTVTVTANALEKKGWVKRNRSSSDARRIDLVPTPEGRRVMTSALKTYFPIYQIFYRAPRSHERTLSFALPRLLVEIKGMQGRDARRKRRAG